MPEAASWGPPAWELPRKSRTAGAPMFRSDSSIVRYETIPPSHNCASTGQRQPVVKRPGEGLIAAQLSKQYCSRLPVRAAAGLREEKERRMILRSRPKEAPPIAQRQSCSSSSDTAPWYQSAEASRSQKSRPPAPFFPRALPRDGRHLGKKTTRIMRRGRIAGECEARAHGVKQHQTAQESGDYLSFKLPYRLNNLRPCTSPRDQARRQDNTCLN